MTAYTTLADSVLQANKPVTEAIGRAGMRDNLQATVEGDASVPTISRIQPRSMDSPYFEAKQTSDYSPSASSGVSFKMHFATEVYDPDSLFDNATNYRFTPNKPGLYMVQMHIFITQFTQSGSNAIYPFMAAWIAKNGTEVVTANAGPSGAEVSTFNSGQNTSVTVTALVQMNGSTDYLEGFCRTTYSTGSINSYQGYMWAVGICQT